jgi:beta-aspartyl-dipeptidase (metallo-type)
MSAENEIPVGYGNSAKQFLLIKGGHLYAPDDLGIQDVLVAGEKIVAVGDNLSGMVAPEFVEAVDATGLLVLPGFIDAHVHICGGGGQGGPHLRNRDILLSSITTAGVTTVVGMIGFDCVTRTMAEIIAKTRALNIEGITAYALTGGYEIPTPTLTGSARRDLAYIEQVIGVGEIAISDHRSLQPTADELKKIAAEARIGGLVANKSGVLVVHLGEGEKGLDPIIQVIEETEIPASQFVPTHVNRNQRLFAQSIEFGKKYGTVDLTAGVSPKLGFPNATKPSTGVKIMLDAGVPLERITLSSDSNGNMPVFNERGEAIGVLVQEVMHLFNEVRDLVIEEGLPVDVAIRPVTSTVADKYKMTDKGRVDVGKDADLLVVEDDLTLRAVYARGKLMVKDGEVIIRGTYES